MSRFNQSRVPKSAPNTVNLAGGNAYSQSPKLELVSLLLTSMLSDQYHESADDQLDRLVNLIGKVDPLFAAKAAVFARNEYGLRSISHAAAGEIVRLVKGESWTKDFITAVVHRADDMTEIMSYYLGKYGKPIPNSLKKGLASAFAKFDSYQLAKYKGAGHGISLVDLVNIVHPNPVDKNRLALNSLIAGTLVSTDTWEAKLSEAGKDQNKDQAKAQAWAELVTSRKIGYFALLRNLRNILETGDADLISSASELLTDEKLIRKSLVMPFRYTTAYEAIKVQPGMPVSLIGPAQRKLLAAINQAVDIATGNVPDMPNSLVVVDYSASMGADLPSNRGKGTLLGAILAKRSNADFMIFGDRAAYIPYDPSNHTMGLFGEFMRHNPDNLWGHQRTRLKDVIYVGHGTNFSSIFENSKRAYDRVFIFSDMQGWSGPGRGVPDGALKEYRLRTKSNPFIYSMDLAGHGTMMFPSDRVAAVPGFSEKIFDLVRLMEQDREALIRRIEEVRF